MNEWLEGLATLWEDWSIVVPVQSGVLAASGDDKNDDFPGLQLQQLRFFQLQIGALIAKFKVHECSTAQQKLSGWLILTITIAEFILIVLPILFSWSPSPQWPVRKPVEILSRSLLRPLQILLGLPHSRVRFRNSYLKVCVIIPQKGSGPKKVRQILVFPAHRSFLFLFCQSS